MKHLQLAAIGIALLFSSTATGQQAVSHRALAFGAPDTGSIIIQQGFVFSYDGRLRSARWVAERLTKESLQITPGVTRKNKYKIDPRVGVEFRAEDDDYVGSGFDRGHLANSANHRSTQALNDDTFYFSNLSPQTGIGFNRHYWARVERSIRNLTEEREVSRVYVFTGPLFMPKNAPSLGVAPADNSDPEFKVTYAFIGQNHVPVPTHHFKAVLAVTDDGFLRAALPKIRVWAYIFPNEKINADTRVDTFAVTTDFLEHWAGFDLWSALADDVERELESQKIQAWAPSATLGHNDVVTREMDTITKGYVGMKIQRVWATFFCFISLFPHAGLGDDPEPQPPAAPAVPGLLASDDTGMSSNDGVTNVAAPTFQGTAPPGVTVELRADDRPIGSTDLKEGETHWSIKSETTLADGDHAITATSVRNGKSSDATSVLSITVDTKAPVAPTIKGFEDDTDQVNDGVTRDTSLTAYGTGDPRSQVTVYFNGADQGTVLVNESGAWSFEAPEHAGGKYVITATAHDLAGNVSPPSNALSVTIQTQSSPIEVGFWLLVPAFVTLLARGCMSWWPNSVFYRATSKLRRRIPGAREANQSRPSADFNPGLIMIIVGCWFIVFLVFYFFLQKGIWEDIAFFDTDLSFPLFVPAFGLLGAMVFIVDVFRKGRDHADVDVGKEFAWRLLLGPYVALVSVLLLRDLKIIDLADLEGGDMNARMAVMAFFSGFLVVLVLQWLTELFHTWLGMMRNKTRYEPSSIAKALNIDKNDDLKLRQAGLKEPEQLRSLAEDPEQLEQLVALTPLEGQFIKPLMERLAEYDRKVEKAELADSLGDRAWEKLRSEKKITTIEDITALSSDELQTVAQELQIDQQRFTQFQEQCRTFLNQEEEEEE